MLKIMDKAKPLRVKIKYSLLLFLQLLDGLFTYIGIGRYGIEAEGNPIIKYLIFHFGSVSALFTVKLIACLAIMFLYYLYEDGSKAFSLVKNGILALYLYAVLCWADVLFNDANIVGVVLQWIPI